jgi:AcrR family transcriptional regulator
VSRLPSEEPAELGLRERKKARTRAEIQQQALRLFAEQGYDRTTIDQIADAAEVSPSTFFRYFPTKEDVVLHDRYDPLLIRAFRSQSTELSPIQALRNAMHAVLGELPPQELAQERQRGALIVSVPELRARSLEQLTGTVQMVAEAIAARVGRGPDEFVVRNFAGALIGVSIATLLAAIEDPDADYLALFDAALAHLEAGLPL